MRRQGWKVQGGAALYLKDRLNGRFIKSFSNGVVEFVIATFKVLDAAFVAIYWSRLRLFKL